MWLMKLKRGLTVMSNHIVTADAPVKPCKWRPFSARARADPYAAAAGASARAQVISSKNVLLD